MPNYSLGVGDRIEVSKLHRLVGETGKIVAVGDNPSARINKYHILFDRDVWGTIGKREIWLGDNDIILIEKAKKVDSTKSGVE